MFQGNSAARYTPLMMLIHAVMAIGLIGAFGVGLYMVDIPGITPFKLRLYNWHKWAGVTLWVLVLLRFFVKVMSKKPPYPMHWSVHTVRMAKLGHAALYVAMFAVPVFGYLYSLAAGFPVVWFGVLELPVLIEKDEVLKPIFKSLHDLSSKALMLLVLGHVAMALKHQFKDRENILGRMIPFVR